MSTVEIVHGRFRYASDVAIFPSGPNQSSATLCIRNATANVATSITAGEWPRNGRNTSRSMSEREHEHDGEAEDDRRPHRPAPLGGHGERERARHHELAVGEVDEAQHAEDEADADGHQRVDRAERNRVGERLPVDVEEREHHEK